MIYFLYETDEQPLGLLEHWLLLSCLTLGIYKCTFTHKKLGIPKEHLASKSLPHLVSLSIDNNLNLNQVPHRQTHTVHTFFVFVPFCCCKDVIVLEVPSFLIYLIYSMFQFNSFMVVIRDMLSRMEAEHKTKLEQLHVMQEQQRCLSQFYVPCTISSFLFTLMKYKMIIHINGEFLQISQEANCKVIGCVKAMSSRYLSHDNVDYGMTN